MSDLDLTDAEFDLLADYVGDALTGVEAERVARLVATDPRWSAAHALLVGASPRVSAALAGLPVEPMPADVVARVAGALTSAAPAAASIAPSPASAAPSGARVYSLDAARSRRRRLAVGIASAAAAIAGVVGGLAVATGPLTISAEDGVTAANAPELVPGADTGAESPPRFMASGIDYREETLDLLADVAPDRETDAASLAPSAVPPPFASPFATSTAFGEAQTRDDAEKLERLRTGPELSACLADIAAVQPGVPDIVDFARFEGSPALIVLLRSPGGISTVVAVGYRCGDEGADLLAVRQL